MIDAKLYLTEKKSVLQQQTSVLIKEMMCTMFHQIEKTVASTTKTKQDIFLCSETN
jgi:hypothetical protein